MKRQLFFLCFVAGIVMLQALSPDVSAQTAADTIVLNNAGVTDAKPQVHSFYAGAGYGNNMVYLGATMSQDHSFGYTSLTYGLMDKLYLSATGYTVSDFSPFLAFYTLGLNFNHTFNSWFDISLNLSRYNVSEKLRDTLFSNFTYADATLGLDWRILYTQFSLGGLISDASQFYFQARNSRYFETPSFAGDKAFFSFDPYVNLLFGTMVTIRTTDGTATTLSPGYRPWKRDTQGSSTTTYSENFGLMEVDFGLPIDFAYDFFTLELTPGYVVPLYSDKGTTGMQGFLFMASIFFRIL
jgi:hypothetical protein